MASTSRTSDKPIEMMSIATQSSNSRDRGGYSLVDAHDGEPREQVLTIARPVGDTETCSDGANDSLLSNKDQGSDKEDGNEKTSSTEHTATWRPTWLQPVVLSIFSALFLIFAASLATMLYISQRNQGLIRTRPDNAYLWRFGPTAVLTVVSIFWSRVETQALRYMPWISHGQKQSHRISPHDFELDYAAMLSPTILYQSLRRKHYLVFLIAIISLILKVQIVLAPGLYNLEEITVLDAVDIEVLDRFKTNQTASEVEDTSPYYIAHATRNFEMRSPFGVSQHGAYQTFRTMNGSRGTADTPLEAVVDGYFTEPRCSKLAGYSHSEEIPAYHMDFGLNAFYIGLRLRFENCQDSILINGSSGHLNEVFRDDNWKKQGIFTHWISYSAIAEAISCARSPPQEGQPRTQSLYFVVRFGKSSSNASVPILLSVSGVLCSSRSWVSKVKVVDDGVSPVVTPLLDEPKIPVVANLWDLIGSSVPRSAGRWNKSTTNRMEGPVKTAITFYGLSQGKTANQMETAVYTNETFHLSVMNMSRILSPWIGHYRLREDITQPVKITGSQAQHVKRLMVNKGICLSMTVIFGLLAVVLFTTLLYYKSMTAIWHQDPATILGIILFFRDKAGYINEETISTSQSKDKTLSWGHCKFTPIVLKKWVRATFVVVGLLIIAGLSYSLNLSQHSEGLATIHDEGGYLHLLWTSAPTIIMLSVALYINCYDSACRGLATLSTLSLKPCSAADLDMSFSDMLGLQALYHSFRARIGVVTLSQILAIICAFLTTLSSALFSLKTNPRTDDIQLQQKSWFGSSKVQNSSVSEFRRQALSALVLRRGDGALTYPQNTYDDLVFPILDSIGNVPFTQNSSVEASIPAARLNPTCQRLSPGDFNITIDDVPIITETFACPDGSKANFTKYIQTPNVLIPNPSNHWYFTAQLETPENTISAVKACGLKSKGRDDFYHSPNRFQTYAWGKLLEKEKQFAYISIWRCNYSWIEVSTEVHLTIRGGELVLDPEKPPRPDLSKTRQWTPPFDIPHVDSQFGDVGDTELGAIPDLNTYNRLIAEVGDWFKPLMKPVGRFSPESFEDPNQDEQILSDLHHLYAFLAAQLANLENRFDITEDSTTDGPPSLRTLEAVATDNNRHRLVQDPIVTYVIIGILSFTVIVNIWILVVSATGLTVGKLRLFYMKVEGLAPDGFNSMAAMFALLDNSNIQSRLPEHAILASRRELCNQLSRLRFRLGWFWNEETQTEHYTIGALGDVGFRFIGSKEQMDK